MATGSVSSCLSHSPDFNNELVQVIPKAGGKVLIVAGHYRGKSAQVVEIHKKKFQAEVELASGDLVFKEYEHICKISD